MYACYANMFFFESTNKISRRHFVFERQLNLWRNRGNLMHSQEEHWHGHSFYVFSTQWYHFHIFFIIRWNIMSPFPFLPCALIDSIKYHNNIMLVLVHLCVGSMRVATAIFDDSFFFLIFRYSIRYLQTLQMYACRIRWFSLKVSSFFSCQTIWIDIIVYHTNDGKC